MKRFIFILMFVATIFNCLARYSPHSFSEGDWYFKIHTNTYSLNIYENEVYIVAHPDDNFFYSGDIVIPETVTYKDVEYVVIGLDATFVDCVDLMSVQLPSRLRFIMRAFEGCVNLKSIEIPSSVKDMRFRAFMNCTGLTHIEMPEVTNIQLEAFSGCENLKTVKIPKVHTIDDHAFLECINLESIEMPIVKRIGMGAFSGCAKLGYIDIPYIEKIDGAAFSRCINLKMDWSLLRNIAIGPMTFQYVENLEHVEALYRYNATGSAYRNIPNLKSVELHVDLNYFPVANIEWHCFLDSHKLEKITIWGPCESVEYGAFWPCNNVKEIRMWVEEPPVLVESRPEAHGEFFNERVYKEAVLYVPRQSALAYGVAPGWRNFYNIVGVEDPADIESIEASDVKCAYTNGYINVIGAEDAEDVAIYDLSGKLVYKGQDKSVSVPNTGIYIVEVAGRSYKVLAR